MQRKLMFPKNFSGSEDVEFIALFIEREYLGRRTIAHLELRVKGGTYYIYLNIEKKKFIGANMLPEECQRVCDQEMGSSIARFYIEATAEDFLRSEIADVVTTYRQDISAEDIEICTDDLLKNLMEEMRKWTKKGSKKS